MNLTYQIINDLSEVDFDDLYNRALDAIEVSWPTNASYTNEQRKATMIAIIESGLANEWPGLNEHGPNDRYVASKIFDLDTGKDMGLVCGFVLEDGTYDGRHSLSAPDENGSRNYMYTDQWRAVRNAFNAEIGVDKSLYRNIPANSVMHRHLRMRAGAGHYEILEDVESPLGPSFRNILVKFIT
jgi:hypothetical protein